MFPIFRDNCLKCHNPDKLKGDLDLTSFSAALKGGGSGAGLTPGDAVGSQLFKSITHADEPTMPPNAKLSERDVGIVRAWIEGGLLQGVNSKALAAARPAADLSLKNASVGRPAGPPVMPATLALEPVVLGERGSALSAVASSPWAPVVALSGTRQIVFYRTSDFEFAGVLPFPEGLVCDVKFSRNGQLLVAGGGRGGKSGAAAVWDVATGERIITIGDQYDSVLAADLSSDQQWIALGGPDKIVKIYRTRSGALEFRLKKHTDWVTALEFSPDGKYLATADRNGGIVVWDADAGQEVFTLPGHRGAVTAISWRDDSEMFVSAGEDGALKLWKAADGSALRSVNAHPGGALAARFAHDGRIVSSGRDNKVVIWDVSGRNLQSLAFSGDLPNRVTFTDDGRLVLGSDWQGKVYVWETKTGKVTGQLDANPPSLAERVRQGALRLVALQQELDKTTAALVALESRGDAEAKKQAEARAAVGAAQSKLAAAKAALAIWTDALKQAKNKPGTRKVSAR
ncbi:MAG: hypothetical protein HZA93_01370 [Verrucomicrobia bacterium]|nr:hypothetical protein [Verrucomicrobiota bacterium]